MLVPEEDIAALEAQVAELLGILEVLPMVGSDDFNEDAISASIRCYADQVERVGLMASNIGFPGLRDVCLLFQENLINVDLRQLCLSDVVRERLEEWPILVIGYLADPTEPQASEPLIEHLRSPVWSIPLTEEQAGSLRNVIAGGVLIPNKVEGVADEISIDVEMTVGVTKEVDAEKSSLIQAMTTEPTLMHQPPLAVEMMEPPTAIPVVVVASEPMVETVSKSETEVDTAGMKSAVLPVGTATDNLSSSIEMSAITASAFIEEEIVAIQTEFTPNETKEPEPTVAEVVAAQAELISDEMGALKPAVLEVVAVQAELMSDETGELEPATAEITVREFAPSETEGFESTNGEDEDEETAGIMTGSGSAGQELLDILCAEIAQIAEAADEMMAVATSADSGSAVRSEALSGYAEHLERFGEASASIGLTGLQQVCASLQANLSYLAAQDHPLTAEQWQVVEVWPDLALNYLQALNDLAACTALANHLQDARWPQPLAATVVDSLIPQLTAAKLATAEVEAETRLQQAQPDDVSLVLPADVNAELLDSLLQELPNQTAEFSASIQRLAAGDGTLKDVDVARRIAHTLKGAGNTVGVRGIAVLTHQIEDILQALATHEALPNRPLAETLLNAADCLETMSEALLGLSAPPTQAQAVLQAVLDWANRIDRTGIPADEAVLPLSTPAHPEPIVSADTAAMVSSSSVATPEATLRVPAHLIDDLLRLVGENIILTGQIQEQVRKTIAQTRLVMGQNRIFQQLTGELEQLVDIRNVSSPLSKSIQRGDFDPLELEQYNEHPILNFRT